MCVCVCSYHVQAVRNPPEEINLYNNYDLPQAQNSSGDFNVLVVSKSIESEVVVNWMRERERERDRREKNV